MWVQCNRDVNQSAHALLHGRAPIHYGDSACGYSALERGAIKAPPPPMGAGALALPLLPPFDMCLRLGRARQPFPWSINFSSRPCWHSKTPLISFGWALELLLPLHPLLHQHPRAVGGGAITAAATNTTTPSAAAAAAALIATGESIRVQFFTVIVAYLALPDFP